MIRILKSSQKLSINRRWLHVVKSIELEEPAYHKTPVDPQVLSLVKKYNDDILYSSTIESNKKPLSVKQRIDLQHQIGRDKFMKRLEQAKEPASSLIAEKFAELSKSEQNNDTQKVSDAQVTVDEPLKNVNESKTSPIRKDNPELANTKLKILTEMSMRQSVIEHEFQSVPDNWMEDYETYDENELVPERQYGTPGK